MDETIRQKVERLSKSISGFSESRMPYTYHHDYIRSHVKGYQDNSRSDIARLFEDVSEEHLYSIAF